MTVLETIHKSTAYLTGKGVESPRLQSESILAHVLQLPRMQLYLNFQLTLSGQQVDTCRELVRRRGTREPLQHILGSVSFGGLEIQVGPNALIPRPETELLVEHALSFLRSLNSAAHDILDFGTGTGCIAIALGKNHPTASVTGCDISPDALELAGTNARAAGVLDQVRLVQSDGFSAIPQTHQFDLIVSNPPYIPTPEIESLEPEVRDHDPRLALDGGNDGLDFYRLLAVEAPARLKPTGALIVEHGDHQAPAIAALLTHEKWIVEPSLADYSGRERFLIARPSKQEGAHLT